MALTLEQIYQAERDKFGMKLIAGNQGSRVAVDWVHMVEAPELISFLKRRELVIVTGIGNLTIEALSDFACRLQAKDASGLIINVGPYLRETPKELIDYCAREDFPLYTLPWETKLVEFSRDVCKRILQEEHQEKHIEEIFLDGMIFEERRKEAQTFLARYGFGPGTCYQLLVFWARGEREDGQESAVEELHYQIENILNRINGHYILFIHDQAVYAVLADYSQEESEQFIGRAGKIKLPQDFVCYCGVMPKTDSFSKLAQYFEKAGLLLRLAIIKKLKVVYYEDMNVYKLLLSVNSKEVLEEFCENILGRLLHYDEVNGTDYQGLLRRYFASNGCIQEIAKQAYVHRNTIHYQLNKIESILGMDLENWENRLTLQLCLLVKDIL